MLYYLTPFLAQAAGGGFISGLSKALGLIMLIGFVFGVIKVIGGASNYNRDPDSAKQSIISGVLIAGSVSLMFALFKAFGIDVAGLTVDMAGF